MVVTQNLLLIESPGKIKKLSQILGPGWSVKATMGHIRHLASDGPDALGFEMQASRVICRFVPRDPKASSTIQELKAAVKQAKRVYLGTDYDREGETIGWHLQQALHLSQPLRAVYTEITEAAVRHAIDHARPLDMDLVHSGLARACLDKLVGFRGSPLLWSLNNGAKSMGRVQSATLHILCQRERDIQAFQPVDYWSVFVDYVEGFRAFYRGMSDTVENRAEAQEDDDAVDKPETQPESTRVLSLAEAERLVELARQHVHQVIQVDGKLTQKNPPAPFTTSTLQQAAGSKLKFNPEQTMKLAQSLYEKGLITYMRTDSVSLSPEFCAAVRRWLEQKDPDNVPQKVVRHRSSKTAQEAHEAIRPTEITRASVQLKRELSQDEFQLYLIIWLRAVASQCKPARIRQTRIVTQSGSVTWQARGHVVEFAGYGKYWKNLSEDANLPVVQQQQSLTLKQAGHEQKQTQPPPRYTEPKLIQVMERRGIGRPSTYAPTVRTLKQRHYAVLEKGKLHPTPLGLEVDTFLGRVLPELLEAEFTAQMEKKLDAIAAGQEDWQHYLTTWNQDYFAPALAQARQLITTHPTPAHSDTKTVGKPKWEKSRFRCPQCQQPLSKIPSKSKKLSRPYFLKCCSCEIVMFYNKRTKKWEKPHS